MEDKEFIKQAKLIKRMLYQFIVEYKDYRNLFLESRTYCSKCYNGHFLDKDFKGTRPNAIQQLYAELELGTFYMDFERMTKMKRDYMQIVNTVRKMNSTNCHWYLGATPIHLNKEYETGREEHIMIDCIDLAHEWVMDY